jgi:hypothetical protein
MDAPPSVNIQMENTEQTSVKLPKNCKENRYYYRHREEILEKQRQKRLEDPEYQAKQKAREEAKRVKEEEKRQKNKELAKEKSRERAKKKAELLGIQSAIPSGVSKISI